MSRNLRLFLGATIIFYIIGAENDSAGMYVLSAACLAVILACYFITRTLIRGVEVELLLHGSRAAVGDGIGATLRVTNLGRIYRAGMSVAATLTNETRGTAQPEAEFLLPPLPARSRTDISLRCPCHSRGVHRLQSLRLIAADPLGVYRRPKPLEATGIFLALPRSWQSESIESWELLAPEGRRSLRMMQRSGGDFVGIREHVPGDDLRHVHWKTTAHTGHLAVKEYQRRSEAEVAIWVDLSQPFASPDDSALASPDDPGEIAISLAATLLGMFTRSDNLLTLSGQALPGYLSLPSRGAAYLDQCLVALAEARIVPAPTLAESLRRSPARSARVTTAFVVSANADEALAEVLGADARRGAQLTVFLVKPQDDDLLARRQDDIALRLRQSGVRTVAVAGYEGIPSALGVAAARAVSEVMVAG